MTIAKSRRKKSVAQFLHAMIEASDKLQQDIANDLGWEKPNMVSMLKLGKAKVPLNKSRALAKSIGFDERDFFFRCLEEYYPEIYTEVSELQNGQPVLTDNEIEIISRIRAARPENPGIKTPEQNAAFDRFIETLTGE